MLIVHWSKLPFQPNEGTGVRTLTLPPALTAKPRSSVMLARSWPSTWRFSVQPASASSCWQHTSKHLLQLAVEHVTSTHARTSRVCGGSPAVRHGSADGRTLNQTQHSGSVQVRYCRSTCSGCIHWGRRRSLQAPTTTTTAACTMLHLLKNGTVLQIYPDCKKITTTNVTSTTPLTHVYCNHRACTPWLHSVTWRTRVLASGAFSGTRQYDSDYTITYRHNQHTFQCVWKAQYMKTHKNMQRGSPDK